MIINSVVGGNKNLGEINHILIKPYYRAVYTEPGTIFYSDDPEVVLTYATYDYSQTYLQVPSLKITGTQAKAVVTYHDWYAVYDNGQTVNLLDIAKNGALVSAKVTYEISSGSTHYYNLHFFNGCGYSGSTPQNGNWFDPKEDQYYIYFINNGSNAYKTGCFSELAHGSDVASSHYIKITVTEVTINGVPYPVSLSEGFDGNVAHPEMNLTAGGQITISSKEYYRNQSGSAIAAIVNVQEQNVNNYYTTGIKMCPIFLSTTAGAVSYNTNSHSALYPYLTTITYNGETWYCSDVQANEAIAISTNYTVYGSNGITTGISNAIPAQKCFGTVRCNDESSRVADVQKVAKCVLDWYYKG